MSKPEEIVITLQGGIGNQLFQLAAGIRLAREVDADISVDLSRYKADTYGRKLILQQLFPDLKIYYPRGAISVIDEAALPNGSALDSLVSFARQLTEKQLKLNGYYQALEFVDHLFINDLHKRLDKFCSGQVRNAINSFVRTPNRLAIHFRRYDYGHHGVIHPHYYKSLIEKFVTEHQDASLCIFTDEPNAVAQLLNKWKLKGTIISTKCDIVDLIIMSNCSAHIIANSTFSWWGAILCPTDNKVFYPSPWTRLAPPKWTLFPTTWTQIEVSFVAFDD